MDILDNHNLTIPYIHSIHSHALSVEVILILSESLDNPHTNYFSPQPHLRSARFSELTTAVSGDYPALETGPGCIIEFFESLPGSRDHHTTDLSPQAAEGRKLKLTLVRISSKYFPIGLNVLHSPTQASLGAVSHRLTSSSNIKVFTHKKQTELVS